MQNPLPPNAICPSYRHDSSGKCAQRIDHFPKHIRNWSENKSNAFHQMKTVESSTCFEGVTRIISPGPKPHDTLEETLASYQQGTLVALSGGLDSLLLTMLIYRLTGQWPVAATLVSHLDGYCEYQRTRELSKKIGLKHIEAFETCAEDFIEALPEAVRAAEVPFYNLHPVSKWLFARQAVAAGFTACITGDGVDQLFTHDQRHDYLPLVGAIFWDCRIELHCPFYRWDIRPDHPNPEKTSLRRLASEYLPPEIVNQVKRGCFTPPLDLSRYGKVTQNISDKANTLFITSKLLQKSHG